jgi:starch synthase (maltosyl-transferring)
VRYHDIERPDSLSSFIGRVNRIRREFAVFKRIDNLQFHPINNDSLICYSKTSAETGECILTIVNLDPHQNQGGWLELPLAELGLIENEPFEAHDLLSDIRYEWTGARNWVDLHPDVTAAHIFHLRRGT